MADAWLNYLQAASIVAESIIFRAMAPQHATYRFPRKPPALQKANLSGFLRGIGRRQSEFLAPDFLRAFEFAVAIVFQYIFNDGIADAALAQFKGEFDGAGAGAFVGYITFGKAAVGKPVSGFQFIQQGRDFRSAVTGVFEFAGEFGATVFPPR
jgi:hypothetical protein